MVSDYTIPAEIIEAMPYALTDADTLTAYNFGQDSSFAGALTGQNNADGGGFGDFFYAPPAGFLALCTQNLAAEGVIPSANFNTIIFDVSSASYPKSITGVGFQPDLIWEKSRTQTYGHYLFDAVRGVGATSLASNTNGAEGADSGTDLDSFDADGFTVGGGDSIGVTSAVAWNWLAGNAVLGTGDFTQGIIPSTCSRNAAAGFSIVSWSGDASATADGSNNSGAYYNIGHGLSTAPEVIMVKKRSSAGGWYMGHIGLGSDVWTAGRLLVLNTTAAATTEANILWGSGTVNSTIFSAGGWDVINRSGSTYIAYCFHRVEGYSKFGAFEGAAGDNDGEGFIFTGFAPAFLIIKDIDGSGGWAIYDNTRDANGNPNNVNLFANANTAEATATAMNVDFLSNGFKIRGTSGTISSEESYLYLAFAAVPFKYSAGV